MLCVMCFKHLIREERKEFGLVREASAHRRQGQGHIIYILPDDGDVSDQVSISQDMEDGQRVADNSANRGQNGKSRRTMA